jgi:inositol-phosphate transport system permease protein
MSNETVISGGIQKRRTSKAWVGFLAPAAFLIIAFFLTPVIITVTLTFTNMSSMTGLSRWEWAGFVNYAKIVRNPQTPQHILTTIKYVVTTLVFFNVGLGLIIALITTHLPKRSGIAFRAIWLLPRLTPSVVYIMMWRIIAADAPYGILNQLIIAPLGFETTNWIPEAAFLFIVLVNGFIGASFSMIIFTSAIESIPRDIMVASLVDGATLLQRIRYVILPQLVWPLLFVTAYQTLSLLTSYEQILLLTDGNFGTEVWSLWAYHSALSNYWGNLQYAFGAALSTILVIIGLVLSIVYFRVFRFQELVREPRID